jgi:hypothetical protein
MSKYMRLIAAAAVIGLFASASAQAAGMHYRMHYRWQSPEENNILSARYDWLLETHPGFRAYHVRKECNPIDFVPALKADCVASFDQYEPMQ